MKRKVIHMQVNVTEFHPIVSWQNIPTADQRNIWFEIGNHHTIRYMVQAQPIVVMSALELPSAAHRERLRPIEHNGMIMNNDMNIEIDLAVLNDLPELLALYRYLNPGDPVLALDDALLDHWNDILNNPTLHYIVARSDGQLVSTCALIIIPNLTRSARPYGLIENVVTHPDYRRRGIATQVLRHALRLAWDRNCYKVMLMTGSKQESTMRFYEAAGFKRGEKTGFIARPSS